MRIRPTESIVHLLLKSTRLRKHKMKGDFRNQKIIHFDLVKDTMKRVSEKIFRTRKVDCAGLHGSISFADVLKILCREHC